MLYRTTQSVAHSNNATNADTKRDKGVNARKAFWGEGIIAHTKQSKLRVMYNVYNIISIIFAFAY